MAKTLEMSESQLSQHLAKKRHKPIGSALARRIERKLKLPTGWLDTANHDLTEESAAFARRYQALDKGQQKVLTDLLDKFRK